MNDWTEMLIDLPYGPAVLVKVTVLLAAAWLAHGLLRGRNPRWRVLLWRGVLVAVVALPLAEWALPRLEVAILEEPAPSQPEARVVAELDPIPSDIALPEAPVVAGGPRPAPAPPPFDLRAWATDHYLHLLGVAWGLIALMLLAGMARGWLRICSVIARSLPAPVAVRALADSIARDLGVYSKVEAASCRLNAAGRRVHLAARAFADSIARDLGVFSNVEAAPCRFNAASRRVHLDVRVVEELGSPFLTGIRRPIIVLPARCLQEPDPAQLRAILAHELAHVKSRDPFWLAFGRVAASLFWFHPLMWRINTVHSAACEEVCDGVAAAYLGSAESYSKALAREALALHTAQPAPGGVPMLRTAEIIHRVRKIQRGIGTHPLARRWVAASLVAGAAVLVVVASVTFVNAEPPAQRTEAPDQRSNPMTPERLLEMVKGKESQIRSFRCQMTTRVEQSRYRGPEYTYFDYIVSRSQFRLIEKAVYADDDIRTVDRYWDGATLTTFRSPDARAEVSSNKPRQAVFTPFDAAGLYTGGAEWGGYLRDLLSQTPPPHVSRVIDDFVQNVVVTTDDGRQRVWLNPARDFFPVKREWFYSEEMAPGAGAIAEYTTKIEETKEVMPGLLLPTKWVRIHGTGPPAPEDAWGLPARVERYDVSLIEVNQDYPPEMFSPDLREEEELAATMADYGFQLPPRTELSNAEAGDSADADAEARPKDAPDEEIGLQAQPDRLPLGRVRVGARVDASVMVMVPGDDPSKVEVRVTPPPFVVIKDKSVDTQPYGERGSQVRCAISLTIDTAKAGEFAAPLRVVMGGWETEIPVTVTVKDWIPGARVLIAESPFDKYSTSDATLFEPWLRIVEAANLDVNYIDHSYPGRALQDIGLDGFYVVLLGEESLSHLTEEDVTDLQNFLNHGGRVILAASAFFQNTVPSANLLLTQYGLEMADEEIPGNTAEVTEAQLPDSRFTRGLTRLGFHRPSPIRILDDTRATILVPDPANPDQGFVAIAKAGAGEVIALGQSLWWDWIAGTHMQPDNGPYDNARLFARLITQPAGPINSAQVPDEKVLMPDLLNRHVTSAMAILEELHMNAMPVKRIEQDSEPDIVFQQHPEAGSPMVENAVVTYYYRPSSDIDVPDAKRLVELRFVGPPSWFNREIRVEVVDETGRRIVFPSKEDYAAGQRQVYEPHRELMYMSNPFEGELTVEFFIDGQKARAYHYVGDDPPVATDYDIAPPTGTPAETQPEVNTAEAGRASSEEAAATMAEFGFQLPPGTEVEQPTPEPASSSLEQKLDTKISIIFDGEHIAPILAFLADYVTVNIALDYRVIKPPTEAASVPDPAYVTDGWVPHVTLKNVPLREALRALCRPLKLDYETTPGFIWVSSPEMIAAEKWPAPPAGSQLSEVEQRLLQLISFEFENNHINRIAEFIAGSTGVNVMVDNRVVPPPPGVTVAPSAPAPAYVTTGIVPYANVRNATLHEALLALLRPLNLAYKAEKDFIWISSPEKIATESFDDEKRADWQEAFYELYRLDDTEVLKRIAPPFIPERRDYYFAEHASQAANIEDPPDYFTFHWDGELKNWGLGFMGGARTLSHVITQSLGISRGRFDGPEELLEMPVPGDWIVRASTDSQTLLDALAAIMREQLDLDVRFEKRLAPRTVVVVSGDYAFTPLPNAPFDPDAIHIFSDEFNDGSGGGSGDLERYLDHLGNYVGNHISLRFVNESAVPPSQDFHWRNHRSAKLPTTDTTDEETRQTLIRVLQNLHNQTGLTYTIETREVETWFVAANEDV